MKTEWAVVKGFDQYQVNSSGVIRNMTTQKILHPTPHNGKQPYLYVTLRKDNKSHKKFVHRIVAETFIENPNNKEQVNHIDGHVQNNNVSNLEWVTNAENTQHAYDTGLNSKAITCCLEKDGEVFEFTSMRKLSRYLGKQGGWLWSQREYKGDDFYYDGYHVKVVMQNV